MAVDQVDSLKLWKVQPNPSCLEACSVEKDDHSWVIIAVANRTATCPDV